MTEPSRVIISLSWVDGAVKCDFYDTARPANEQVVPFYLTPEIHAATFTIPRGDSSRMIIDEEAKA